MIFKLKKGLKIGRKTPLFTFTFTCFYAKIMVFKISKKLHKKMIISWHGFNYFKLKNSQHSLVLNPYSLDKTTKFSKAKADVVLFTDGDKTKASKIDKESFVIDSAGEYEVSDFFIYGYKIRGQLVYLIIFEGIRILFFGEFGHQELSNGDLEFMKGVDIFILPVGGEELTTAKEAVKIIGQIEPRMIIPSCHNAGSFKLKADNVTSFIKEFGVKPEEVDKLKIKKKDLPQEEVKLIILKSLAK